jgi:enoyl-CoA hydratase/carnithine racemase
MDFEYITLDITHDIATITLNRPLQMNSLDLETVQEMVDAIDICGSRKEVRVVVLTGVGDAFSAGVDIKSMSMAREMSAQEIAEAIETRDYPLIIKKLMSLPIPVIASVNGICLGAGTEIALACDYIIASNKATFGQLFVNVGLIGNTYLLPRVVGLKKALELIWSGKVISAEEAYQMGIVNQVVLADALIECTYKVARTFAKGPTMAMGMAKKAVYEALNMDLEQGLHVMCRIQGELMKSQDHQEGVAAFLEKRKPHFTGK